MGRRRKGWRRRSVWAGKTVGGARQLESGRVYCLFCNRHERLRKDGTFMAHRVTRYHFGEPLMDMFCLGTYRTPAQAEAHRHETFAGDIDKLIHHPNATGWRSEEPALLRSLWELRRREREEAG